MGPTMTTTLPKGLKGLLAGGLGASTLALAPHAVGDTNDNAYVNAVEATYNIHSVGGSADLIYAGQQVCGFLSPSVSPAMVTDHVYRASLYGNRFYTNSLGGSHIPITNGQASILVNYAIGAYCSDSQGARHWRAPSFPIS
jgi:Protein of unknown function (DUF732)